MSSHHGLLEDDESDQKLISYVAPPDWKNPTPSGRYNLVVIGGGPAGLVAALGAAGLGAKVALIEKGLLGGDCLNFGCVPSKSLLHVAHAAEAAKNPHHDAIKSEGISVDFSAVMASLRKTRASIGPHDGAERFTKDGIDVFMGSAEFVSLDTVKVAGQELTFSRCCIATGASAFVPPIPGAKEAGVRTNETLFKLTKAPEHLVVVGGGVIGCEMAQAFRRLGVKVSLVETGPRILGREDEAASSLVLKAFQEDGISVYLESKVTSFEIEGEQKITRIETPGGVVALKSDEILLAVGRRANTKGLNLKAAGVQTYRRGVKVNEYLQTSNSKIYGAGDVIGEAQFTHAADFHARAVIKNALFFGFAKHTDLIIPRVIYTKPEVASVGLSTEDAENRSDLTLFEVALNETDRGRTDELEGYCKVYADSKGKVHSVVIVGYNAGELLAPLTFVMTQGLSLSTLASTIHPYPTQSEVVFKVASLFNKTRLTPFAKSVLQTIVDWRR